MKTRTIASKQAEAACVTGKFAGTESGFGFVISEDRADVFIPEVFTLGALHGDTVTCITEPGRKPHTGSKGKLESGTITEIIKRANHLGIFHTDGVDSKGAARGIVKPYESKIPHNFTVNQKSIKANGLLDGHVVSFSVSRSQTNLTKRSKCFIKDVIGHLNDPGTDVLMLVKKAAVPYAFPPNVLEEASEIPETVSESETIGRADFRGMVIFTIDGEDTKDIDDAISFEVTSAGNYKLGVHIADVAHYVKEKTALDNEALKRGTSIYLADRVIPMLPHRLSNGICSLFPNVDRLAMSCLMTVSPEGAVLDYHITPSVIHSRKQWTYKQVQDLIEDGDDEWASLFCEMDKLRQVLRDNRDVKGALDFDIPEAKIRVDELGRTTSVELAPRNLATSIIEEFMILTNETVASHAISKKIPFVFRTHEAPKPEKKAVLAAFAENLGYKNAFKNTTDSKGIQRLLAATKNTTEAYAISTAVLQSLEKACYTNNDPAHFGLASKNYCHFTSPIRRYADLQIHRILKDPDPKRLRSRLSHVCTQTSTQERIAEALEREVASLKKVQFMKDKVGMDFEGIVSGVTTWGVYVMLENTAEGLICRDEMLRHQFAYVKELHAYRNRRTRKNLRHGTKVKVRLAQVVDNKINFTLH